MDRARIAYYLSRDGDIPGSGRFADCGTPGLGFVGICVSNPSHSEVYHPFSCMLRICPTCAARRSAQLAASLEKPIAVLAEAAPRHYTLKHLILTTSVSLSEDTDNLRSTMRRYRIGVREILQGLFPADKIMGGLIGAEFGENGRKLHFHVLLLSRYIDKEKLEKSWFDLTAGRGRWSFIRKLAHVSDGIAEICKYVTKPTAEDDGEEIESVLAKLHFVLKGVRRFQAFGSFFRMDRNEAETENVCRECGSVLMWQSELDWMQHNSAVDAAARNALLYLKEANKSPPVGYNQLAIGGSFADCYPPTPPRYN